MAPSVQGPELAASKRALATGSSDESEDSVNILYRGDLRRIQRKKAGRKANIARAIGRSTEEATATVYEACIERNWGCRFRDSLPSKLRPTRRRTNGARSASKLGLIPATRPAEWSRKIKEALCELSRATPGNMAYAHDLLIMQVRQRQTTKAHPEHYAGKPDPVGHHNQNS